MTVTLKDVEHVMTLARLGLTEEEKKKFTSQLNNILEYAKTLSELETDQVPPTSHSLSLKNVTREDTLLPWKNPEELVQQAPEEEAGFYLVPRILDES